MASKQAHLISPEYCAVSPSILDEKLWHMRHSLTPRILDQHIHGIQPIVVLRPPAWVTHAPNANIKLCLSHVSARGHILSGQQCGPPRTSIQQKLCTKLKSNKKTLLPQVMHATLGSVGIKA